MLDRRDWRTVSIKLACFHDKLIKIKYLEKNTENALL
jgi:hypothetical protein